MPDDIERRARDSYDEFGVYGPGRGDARWVFWLAVFIIWIFLFALVDRAWPAPNITQYPNCRGWISATCCCTSEACREVEPGELVQLSEDTYRVVATGEVVRRTGWSQDGSFIRCAAQYEAGKGWLIGPQYRTRCLWVPVPAS